MKDNICIMLTTIDNKKYAKKITRHLLKTKLAACIQQNSIKSRYVWENRIVCEKEFLLNIKTTLKNRKKIKRYLAKHHPYKVPEYIAIKGKCAKNYKKWLDCALT